MPFVRYAGAGCGLISSKWCNRPWRVTLQYQFDPVHRFRGIVNRRIRRGRRAALVSIITNSNGLVNLLVTSSPLPPSCYYLNSAFFASLQRYILLSSNVFERRKSSTSSSTRYNMRSIVGRRVEFRIILFGNCRARNFNIKRDNALLETWIWKKFWKETF